MVVAIAITALVIAITAIIIIIVIITTTTTAVVAIDVEQIFLAVCGHVIPARVTG